jgi:alcohol dehydrogenase (cytochrome c)
LKALVALGLLCVLPLCARAQAQAPSAEPPAAGRATFESRCSGCHGADGNGGELGPAIAWRLAALTDSQLQITIQGGLPTRGMPANDVGSTELPPLIAYLRSLRPRQPGFQPYRAQVQLVGGQKLAGLMLAEGFGDAQLRTDDHQLHLLRRTEALSFREVSSEVDWSTYNGNVGGNRYTQMSQITKANVRHVAPRWVFRVPNTQGLQVTPVVANGVMYVTNSNECYALDAGSGRQIWHYQRPRTTGLIGNGASGANRGVAVAGDKVYMVTDNAHLLALNRADGTVAWEIEMADWRKNYGSTSAPLIVGKLVIVGSAGGEEGARGFLAAFDQSTGKEAWRFWTVPLPGEPGSETWAGKGIEHGGSTAWFTGVYDAETDTLFWPTGNPGEDYNGDERGGDDLYSDCILALDPKTGKLKWYYQTTPHDLWDWDSSETPLVIDANWQGKPRQLLVQGNRNGFFYVLDRTNGKLLLGKPFIRELTWATGIGADGKPIKVPGQEPSEAGTRVCPSQDGATNWYSPSYNPATGLFYMQTNEMCSIYMKRSVVFEYGKPFLGGAQSGDRKSRSVRILRALDLQTGTVKWELPEVGTATSWGGTLSTATGLVFFGEDSGTFAAADAVTGKALWSFDAGASWHASPMTYQFDGQQLIAVAAGANIIAFGLVQ